MPMGSKGTAMSANKETIEEVKKLCTSLTTTTHDTSFDKQLTKHLKTISDTAQDILDYIKIREEK